MTLKLKIKIASLAMEARYIRRHERAIKRRHRALIAAKKVEAGTEPPALFFEIQSHRRLDIRQSSRAAGLAYGFLRGTPYAAMEGPTTRSQPDWKLVEKNVRTFARGDEREVAQRFAAWKEGQELAAAA